MLGELFTPIETPEAQNRGFLKGFFGGNANTFDREELCMSFVLLFFFFLINMWIEWVLIPTKNITSNHVKGIVQA